MTVVNSKVRKGGVVYYDRFHYILNKYPLCKLFMRKCYDAV